MKNHEDGLKTLCEEIKKEIFEKEIDRVKMSYHLGEFKRVRIKHLLKRLDYDLRDLLEGEMKFFFSNIVMRCIKIISHRLFVRLLTSHIVTFFEKYSIVSDSEKISALLVLLKVRSPEKTYNHVLRLAYFVDMAMRSEFLGRYTDMLSDTIIQNCLIHDIGKVFWTERYFSKVKLYQRSGIRRHVIDGVFLCNALKLDERFLFVMKTHHYINGKSPHLYSLFKNDITDNARVLWQVSSLMDLLDGSLFRGEIDRRDKSGSFGRVNLNFVIKEFLDRAIELNIEPNKLIPLFKFIKKELLIPKT